MIKFILSLMLCSQIVFADCKPVQYLSQGEPAQCGGYLFSPAKELQVRGKVEDYDRLTELSKKQDELISVLNQRIDVQTQTNDNLRANLKFEEDKSFWTKALYFGLGVLATGLVVYSVKQVK